jgi:hypothetical protein
LGGGLRFSGSLSSFARSDHELGVVSQNEEADERWRDVLFVLVKRANEDPEFRARVEATGAVITNFEGVLQTIRADRMAQSGTIACHEYWWGFQLEIPHAVLMGWPAGATESGEVAAAIGVGTGPSAPFRKRAAAWIASRLEELQALDHGAGIYTCMMWMAPNIFVPLAIERGGG